MAITLFGTASTPTDPGTNTSNPTIVTPPGSMVEGDLCFIIACGANTSGTLSILEAAGQTWTALTQRNAARNRSNCFWCRFNGTWPYSPSVTMTGTANNIVRMLVFRPDGGSGSDWSVSVAVSSGTYSAPASPYTVSITGPATAIQGDLVIATWTSADDNTWGAPTGSLYTWTNVTPAQIRNTSGTYDQSVSNAWLISPVSGNVGTVSKNQATLGGDAGTRHVIAFREYKKLAGTTVAVSGAAATGTTYPPVSVAGSSAAVSGAVAFIRNLIRAKATAVATSTAEADLSVNPEIKVAGTSAATTSSTAKGYLSTSLRGLAASVATATARATCTFLLAGTVAAASSATGTAQRYPVLGVASAAATSTASASASLINKYFGFYNWLVATPAVGGIAGPKIGKDCHVSEVSSYVTAATSVTFNVEERTTPESAGTNLLSADQVADADGTTTGTISNDYLSAGNTLWLDISATSGTPAILSATVTYFYYTEPTPLAAIGSSAAVSSASGTASVLKPVRGTAVAVSSATATTESFTGNIKGFYNWLLSSLSVGRVPGPKLPTDILITEVSGYVMGGTSASFNLEDRNDPSVVGPLLLTSDLSVGTSGASTTSFINETVAINDYLWLYVRSLEGSPSILSVTVYWVPTPVAKAVARAVSSATASATVESGLKATARARFGCTGDFVRARFVTASASSDASAGAGALVTIEMEAEASAAAISTATAYATVDVGGASASAAGVATATAKICCLRPVHGSAAGVSSATAKPFSDSLFRAYANAVSHATATADWVNRASASAAAQSSGTAKICLLRPAKATSAGASSSTAKLTYAYGTLAGTAGGTSTATATLTRLGGVHIWVKILGVWRPVS